jgi:acetyl-CoA decarbonylase/synthase complex subunit gamma
MQIYKLLPKTNCKECGFPTCMAFAMQVAAKQKAITDCPHLSQETQKALAEESSPPMRLVKIGPEGNQFQIGQETVMFRHEEKFHRPAGIAVKLASSLTDEEVKKKVEKINQSQFNRIGQVLKVELCALEVDGLPDPAARARTVAESCSVPLVLMGKEPADLDKAAGAVADQRPLLYRAAGGSLEAVAEVAGKHKLPMAVGADSLEELEAATGKAKEKGAEDLVLSFGTSSPGETLRRLTTCRRAALKQNFRPLGYPAMVDIAAGTPEYESVLASCFAAKYAGIVIIKGDDPWELLPVMTTVQNVYTDPQVPNTVEAKLYEIGQPNENSPVLFTTNFSLTYFTVEAEVERSKVPAYIAVVDTEGLGVLNAYAGDKISAEKVVKTLNEQKVLDKVKHRKLIIPGLLPVFRAEIEDTSEWKEVVIGPENAREIPGFLTTHWK